MSSASNSSYHDKIVMMFQQRRPRPCWVLTLIAVLLAILVPEADSFVRQQSFLPSAGVGAMAAATTRSSNQQRRVLTLARRKRPSSLLPLSMVASKTGAKLIASPEEYTDFVMNPDRSKPVLVFFTAPWCGPCRLSIPVVRDVMKKFSGQIDAVEVDTDNLPDVAADSNVVSIPTIQMYFKGECCDTIIGCVAKGVLSSAVDKVLEDVAQTYGTVANSTDADDE